MRKVIMDGDLLYVPTEKNKSLGQNSEIVILRDIMIGGGCPPMVIEYAGLTWMQTNFWIVGENFEGRPAGSIEYGKDYFRFRRCIETKNWEMV